MSADAQTVGVGSLALAGEIETAAASNDNTMASTIAIDAHLTTFVRMLEVVSLSGCAIEADFDLRELFFFGIR